MGANSTASHEAPTKSGGTPLPAVAQPSPNWGRKNLRIGTISGILRDLQVDRTAYERVDFNAEANEPEPREASGVTWTYVTRDDVVARVAETARRAGLTFEEFMADGITGWLTDGDCRDDWLIYRDILLDEEEPVWVRQIDRAEIVELVTKAVEHAGLTIDEFLAGSEASSLMDLTLHDLWLIYDDFRYR